MQLPKHIVMGTDFSDGSRSAVRAAANYATAFGAGVSLLHVFDPMPRVPPAAIPTSRAREEQISEEMAERVRVELSGIRAEELSDVPEVEVHALRNPNPAIAICDFAQRSGADLIVVGTHGRTGLGHLLVGSVAERVVRHAPCPVLTVRYGKPPEPHAQQS